MATNSTRANARPLTTFVRQYEETDEPAVVAMAEAARALDPGSPHLDSSRWRFVCTDAYADPETTFRVAVDRGGSIAGVAYRFDPPSHDGGRFRAVFVVVDPPMRRRGIGRALYEAVACEKERDTADAGWHLATSLDDRSLAGPPFAKAMGFKKTSERIVMRRELPGRPLPEIDSEATIERFLGANAYQDWAAIDNAAFAGTEGAAAVTAEDLERSRPEGFRPEHVRFARIGSKRVGVLFIRETSTGGFIETLAVLPEAAGQSIATGLVGSALEYLHERGHGSCELVVDHRNSAALKIYTRLGFEEVARRSFLVKRPKARRSAAGKSVRG